LTGPGNFSQWLLATRFGTLTPMSDTGFTLLKNFGVIAATLALVRIFGLG
jgi:hypothetical protein